MNKEQMETRIREQSQHLLDLAEKVIILESLFSIVCVSIGTETDLYFAVSGILFLLMFSIWEFISDTQEQRRKN